MLHELFVFNSFVSDLKSNFRTSHFRSTVNTLGSTTAHEIVPILDSLNQLGNVAWTVNEPVSKFFMTL